MVPRGHDGPTRLPNLALLVLCLAVALPSCCGLRLSLEGREEEQAELGDICVWKEGTGQHRLDQASTKFKTIWASEDHPDQEDKANPAAADAEAAEDSGEDEDALAADHPEQSPETSLYLYNQDLQLRHEKTQPEEAAFLHTERRVPCNLTQGESYLMVVNAFEQFGGARQVLGDTLALAKQTNRVMIEPVLKNGRVVNPFFDRDWVPLSQMLDIDAMKRYWPKWISIQDFLSRCDVENGLPPMEVLMRKERISEATLEELKTMKTQIVAMSNFMRKGGRQFTNASMDGVPLEPSKWIADTAQEVMKMLDPRVESNGYICAHWRSEGVALKSMQRMDDCAEAFKKTVHKTMTCALWEGYWPKVFLLSDLRAETSDTIKGNRLRAKYATELDKRLHYHQATWALEKIKDLGQRALVEQYICSRARIMVGCPFDRPGKTCGRCARVQSKYAMQIIATREELGMPRPINW